MEQVGSVACAERYDSRRSLFAGSCETMELMKNSVISSKCVVV